MAQVKGIAILGLIKFIKKNMKDDLPKIIASLPPETRKYVGEHILLTEWYPYTLYTDLLKMMDRVVGRGDLSYCIEQGKLSAQHDLSTVYRIFLNFISPNMIINKAMSIGYSCYDVGKVEASMLPDHGIVVTIKEFPDIDIAHVKNAQGWLEQFLVMCKFQNVKSGIEKCPCYGDPCTEIRFTFKSEEGG